MKKLIVIFCIVILAGCNHNNTPQPIPSDSISSESVSESQSKEENKKDESSETIIKNTWNIYNYVDDFNQPTEIQYVRNTIKFIGAFSNSATTNSTLYVIILADKDNIAIMLYEYGSSLVKNSYSRSIVYDITIKTTDGKKKDIIGVMSSDSDRIVISSKYENDVINALSEDGIISFYIVQEDRKTTTYLFDVETSGFNDLFNSIV